MISSNSLKETLHFYNPWWETERVPRDLLKEYQRPVLKDILSYLFLDRVIVLKGPRRTGKSTLLYQVADALLRRGVPPHDILFLSFDDIKLRMDMDDILKGYQEISRRLIKTGKPVYLLLDEVHFLDNWQFYVKKYFDRKYPVKFIVSGSAATLIRRGSESLAGRTIEETIYPFSFYEYLCYRLKKDKLTKIISDLREAYDPFKAFDTTELIPYRDRIRILFEEYKEKGGFPNLFGIDEALIWKRIAREDIVEKVIYRDLVELYDIKKPEALEKLFLYLVDITSNIFSVANISNSLGISREYTEKYIYYLEQALLVKRIRKLAKFVEKTIRGAEKVHVLDTGLINAFSKIEQGKIVESMVTSHLMRLKDRKLYYFREKYEVDIVLERDKELLPVEIKYKDDVRIRELKGGLGNFFMKFKADSAVVVTRDLMNEDILDGHKIIFMPAWLFVLLSA